MTDMASHSAPHPDTRPDTGELRHTLTVHDVGAALVAAGVPRSHRQVVRYCETGMLDAVKVPGPTGAQWFVSPVSLPKAIGDLKQWEAQRARHGTPKLDTARHDGLETTRKLNPDTAGSGEPQPAVSDAPTLEKGSETQPDMARYVGQLEQRIAEKDDVIGLLKGQLTAKDEQIGELSTRFGNLSDRFADTQKLLGAMQRMFAPLLGQSDPFNVAEKREAAAVDNSAPPAGQMGV